MRDLRHMGSPHRNRRAAPNRIKVKKEPLDLKKYLLPLIRYGSRIGLLALLVWLVVASVNAMAQSNPFPVKRIEVHGTQRLDQAELVELSGIEAGQNMFKLGLKTICQRLSSNPWVASVSVQRFFPGTVSIRVVERNPVAVLNIGLLYYLDEQAQPFKPLGFGDRLDYPVVTGLNEDQLTNDPDGSRVVLESACKLLESIQQYGSFIQGDLSEIHFDKDRGFTIYTTSRSLPIRIGRDDFSGKLQRFARVYKNLVTQVSALRQIDLDYSDRIVVKKQEG